MNNSRDEPPTRAPRDNYEADYMPGRGDVVHRSKQVSRLLAGVLLVPAFLSLLVGAFLVAGLAPDAPAAFGLIPLVTAALLAFCGLTLTVLRTVVTSEEVHVQYGLWGPRIPIDAIRSCRVIPYDAMKFGGWGLKYRDGTWTYTMYGADVVELEWDEDGKKKVAVVSSDDPVMLARKIQQARGVRIALGDGARDSEVEAEEEALAEEALADEEASASRSQV